MANHIVTGDQYKDLDGQLFELKRQLRQPGGYPHDPALLKDGLQTLIEGRFAALSPPTKEDEGALKIIKPGNSWLKERTKFYDDVLGLKVDLSKVVLPPTRKGFGWDVVMARELGDKPTNTAMDACRKLFKGKVGQFADDLDAAVPSHERDPRVIGSYAIRVRNRVEADEENEGLSAIVIAKRKIITMTLPERVVLGLFYYWKTGKHLDIQNWTLCSGSRDSDGCVPDCHLRGVFGYFEVDYYHPADSSDSLRARSAVAV